MGLATEELQRSPRRAVSVTKSDSTDVTKTAKRGLWIGGAGDVSVMYAGDTVAVTLLAVPAGTFLPGEFKRVMSTGTTATSIISFYD